MVKSKEYVQSWLIKVGFEDYCQCFKAPKPLEATTPPATLIEDDVNNPDNQCTSTAMQEQPRSPTATPESEGSRRNSGHCNAGFAIAPEAESRKGLSERLCAIYPCK
ncbi:Hypothetical predicted protein [Paramuricea clavata]|uniref:Uncharacterized protein n=1 Tax=Paramuricea clavata TaxID=317549 RepID=A0A6S7GBV9_PARCT|nr:Hypothetical predicted protein [Paramuricea clavata]